MIRDSLLAVAAGLLSAVLLLSSPFGLLGALMFQFTPLPLFAAGLGLGLAGAGFATLTAASAVAAVGGADASLLYILAVAVPVLLFVRFALLHRTTNDGDLEWYPPGLLLTWLTLYGCGGFLAIAVIAGAGADGLQGMISRHVDEFRGMVAQSDEANARVEQIFDSIKLIFPFVVTSWWLVVFSVNSVLAQKFLAPRGWSRRPSPDLRTVALPEWLNGVVVAAAVVALVGSGWLGFVAVNIVLILCVPYFLVGLAVLHSVSAAWTGRTAILCAAYLFLLLFGWTALVVVGLGFVEYWAGLREKFGSAGGRDEGNE